MSLDLASDTVVRVCPLSIVPEGDEFLVGDPVRAEFVLLPRTGLQVIQLLASGRSLREVAAQVGPDVDVADFIETLFELQFITDAPSSVPPGHAGSVPHWRIAPELVRPLAHPVAWFVYSLCALFAGVLLVVRGDLVPSADDFFFLDSPLVSLACITLIAYALAACHELYHWVIARAAGVDARVTVSRRLYFLTFETDLSRLWTLPRRRRYGPLLAGMAFDAVVLCAVLAARLADAEGWVSLGHGASRLLAAIALVQLTALASQFFVFARTDLYAVLVTATGCVNLWRVNRLRLLAHIRRLSEGERSELADAHARDLHVARLYGWLYVLGLVLAMGYFVRYFVPASVRMVGWLWTTLTAAQMTGWEFWLALAFAVVVISPHALTLMVLLRELRSSRAARRLRIGLPDWL